MKKTLYTKPVTVIASTNIGSCLLAGSPDKWNVDGGGEGGGEIKKDEGKGPDAKDFKWGIGSWDDINDGNNLWD